MAALTEVVTQVRRELRGGIRTDDPWESPPMAQGELLPCVRAAGAGGLRMAEIARFHLAPATTRVQVGEVVDPGAGDGAPDPADRATALHLTALVEDLSALPELRGARRPMWGMRLPR